MALLLPEAESGAEDPHRPSTIFARSHSENRAGPLPPNNGGRTEKTQTFSSSGLSARNWRSSRTSYVIFNAPAQISGHPNEVTSSIMPAGTGAAALARLRGTLVTLAAAARSSGGTTAITYDWRAGTSIDDIAARSSRNTIARGAFGISAARIRNAL